MKIHIVFHSRKFQAAFLASISVLVCLVTLLGLKAPAATPDLPAGLRQDAVGKMVLVDFYSQYCGACIMMEPHLQELKKQTGDKVVFKRIDVTTPDNNAYIDQYAIKGTPTYVLYGADGKAIYRMEDLISPAILEKQVLRSVGQLKNVSFPSDLSLPAAHAGTARQLNDLILVSFENKDCVACKAMTPYLSGFEMSGQEGLTILHLDTATVDGKKMMDTLSIKHLPAYVLFDNSADATAGKTSTATGASDRGELFRMEGEVKPRVLWDIIKIFGQAGV